MNKTAFFLFLVNVSNVIVTSYEQFQLVDDSAAMTDEKEGLNVRGMRKHMPSLSTQCYATLANTTYFL